MNTVRDSALYLGMMTPILLLFTFHGHVLTPPLLLLAACTQARRLKTNWEPRWINWFEITKLLGALAAVAAVVLMQGLGFYNHRAIATLLAVNIILAVVSALHKHGTRGAPNAVCGLAVAFSLPWSEEEISRQTDGIFRFPSSPAWILSYTAWNATFAYGFGYSATTRLVLIPPVLIALFLGDSHTWLGPRAYSLLLNMAFRALKLTYLFTPGRSAITVLPDRAQPDARVFLLASSVNLLLLPVLLLPDFFFSLFLLVST
jgi:hypothetical protein